MGAGCGTVEWVALRLPSTEPELKTLLSVLDSSLSADISFLDWSVEDLREVLEASFLFYLSFRFIN